MSVVSDGGAPASTRIAKVVTVNDGWMTDCPFDVIESVSGVNISPSTFEHGIVDAGVVIG